MTTTPSSALRRAITLATSLALLLTALAWVVTPPARAADTVTLTGQELHEALFVAGEADRLSTDPRAAFLEKVLQELYVVRPGLGAAEAVAEIERLESAFDTGSSTSLPARKKQGIVVDPQTIFRVDHYKALLRKDAKKAAKAAKKGTTRRAVRKVVKEVLADRGNGAGSLPSSATNDSWSGQPPAALSVDAVARQSIRQAQMDAAFAEARDLLWLDEAGQSVTATISERLEDPDLAAASELTSQIENESLTVSVADAEAAADKALNGSDTDGDGKPDTGAAGVRSEALSSVAEIAKKEEEAKAAATQAEKAEREKELKALKEKVSGVVDDAEKLLKNAKTVTALAVQLIEKFDPAAAEAIEEIADVVFPIAETVLDMAGSVANGVMNVLTGNWVGAVGNVVSLLSGVGSLFFGESATEPKPDPVKEALAGLKEDIAQLRQEMHERFDRIDASLNAIFETMVTGLTDIQGRLDVVDANVKDVLSNLTLAQAALNRLEARVYENFRTAENRSLSQMINLVLGYQEREGRPLNHDLFVQSANYFHTWATDHAFDDLSLVSDQRSFSDADLTAELMHPLDTNIDYLRQFGAQRLNLPPLANSKLANPRDWAVSARAFEQLLLENPAYVTDGWMQRLDEVRAVGMRIEEATGRIVAADSSSGEGTGSRLFDGLLDLYADRWADVDDEIDDVLAAYRQTMPGQLDPFGGATQPATLPTRVTVANTMLGCGDGKTIELGTDTVEPIPASSKVAVVLGLGFLTACVTASWTDFQVTRRTVGPPGGQVVTETLTGKLRTTATWSFVDRSTGGGYHVSRGVHTAGLATALCRRDADLLGESISCATNGRTHEQELSRLAYAELATTWVENRDGLPWAPIAAGGTAVERIVNGELGKRQQAAYAKVADAYVGTAQTPQPAVQRAAAKLTPIKRLITMYLEAGVPGDLAADGELRGLLQGSDRLPDPSRTVLVGDDEISEMAVPWLEAASELPPGDLRDVQDDHVAAKVDRLTKVLRDHILGTVDEALPPLASRQSGLVDGTLDRLELAGYVLRGDGPVVIITAAPTTTDEPRPVFTFAAGEEARFECRIHRAGALASFGPCSGDGEHRPTAPLADGDYVFDVRAFDEANNLGEVASVTFRINTGATPGDSKKPGSKRFTALKSPKIRGKARVGKKLKVRTGRWSPTPSVIKVRWLRNGKAIKGKAGKKKAYRVRRADRGKKISVRVTVKRRGLPKATAKAKAVRIKR